LSDDAPHDNVNDDVVAPEPTSPDGADGADESTTGHAAVEALVCERAERFPPASNASTDNVYPVPHVSPLTVNDWLVVVASSVAPL
jgi:hypothetical protein